MSSNEKVAIAWKENRNEVTGNMYTDGVNIYSYQLRIGTTELGSKISFPYTAGEGNFISDTTSRHCHYAGKYADERRFRTILED